MKDILPFGMLFEELVTDDYSFPQVKYDLEQNVSVVKNEEGRLVPFVKEHWNTLATGTATKVRRESTDEDPSSFGLMGTKTFTEVRAETTDSDVQEHCLLGTETVTRFRPETTDSD